MVEYKLLIAEPWLDEASVTRETSYSSVQSVSWKVNSYSAGQEIPRDYEIRMFITIITQSRHGTLY
jgi:hypothetical protein